MDIKGFVRDQYKLSVDKIIERGRVYEIQTPQGRYALKQFDYKLRLPFHIAVLQHLEKIGFKQTHRIIPTTASQPLSNHEGIAYLLTNWIDGTHPDFIDESQLRRAAAYLAQFHLCSHTLQVDEKKLQHIPIELGNLPKLNRHRLEKLFEWEQTYKEESFRKAIGMMEQAILKFPQDIYDELVHEERERDSFVHGDYNKPNIVIRPDGGYALIDFDNCSRDIRVNDLIFLCQLHVAKDPDRALAALRAYHKFRPLSKKEFTLIKSQLLVPLRFYQNINTRVYVKKEVSEDWLKQIVKPFLSRRVMAAMQRFSYSDL